MSAPAPRSHRPRVDIRGASRLLLGLVAAIAVLMPMPGTAQAHTGFESSSPADGETVDEPVDVVTVTFTGEANPVGDKFVALTPDGVLHEAESIETVDDKVFAITFDPPLAGGRVGIRWRVQAADAHPIEGAFSFTVNAPAPTTAAPTTIAPTTIPATTSPAVATTSPAAPATTVGAPSDVTVDTSLAVSVDQTPPVADESTADLVRSTLSLDEFLTVQNTTPGETTATVGRLVGFTGVVLGLGALAFLATTLRGRRDEVLRTITGIRVLGAVIVLGAAIEYVGVSRIGAESLSNGWSTSPGFTTVLRAVGGIGLVVGISSAVSRGRVQRPLRRPSSVRSLSAAVVDQEPDATLRRSRQDEIVRWKLDSRSWPAMVGAVLIVASFWFDGHTVSKGFRPLHALANGIHVVAAAVWVGGVVTMAAIAWSRHRSGHSMRMVELVVRFSKIATIALASVIVAGAIMAIQILDSFGELTGTPWGQILLLKSAAVGLAMIAGAYNHFRLLPALEADPESPERLAQLRSTVTAEAILLLFVVAVTAWLVAAAS